MKRKYFAVKVYDQDGTTLLKVFPPKVVKNDPSFPARINGGLGSLTLDLNLPFDDFDEGDTIKFMNIVDVRAVVVDTEGVQTDRRIYRGFISQYEPYLENGDEGVRVTVLGLGSLLTFAYYEDAGNYTVTHTAEDPSDIFKAIVDHFNTVYGGSLITYDGTSIPGIVGTDVTAEYADKKHFDAIRQTMDMAPEYWWTIDCDGKANMQERPASAVHTFTIDRDIASAVFTKDSERVVNDVIVRYDGGTHTDDDAASQATYGTGDPATGKRTKIVSNTAIDVNGATQAADKILAEESGATISAKLTISDKYDIESIRVGQSCKIRNFKLGNSFFTENMLIVATAYSPNEISVDLERSNTDFGLQLADFVSA